MGMKKGPMRSLSIFYGRIYKPPNLPTTVENYTSVPTATKFKVIKLIDLAGLIYMSPTNWLLSITEPGLFVLSQTTKKSKIPL